ncbi:MAG TPA: hypothetical protein VJ960_08130, partial [Oceanipulchritudo sp.]|nr:hypothetical protein [Oceanipulchritudo sp.]
IDRTGVKPVFRVALLVGVSISIYWFFLVSGSAFLLQVLPLAYFAFGIQTSQWITAHLKYMPRVCSERRQALHVSVHSAVIGVIGGLAPIFWGFFVKVPGTNPGVRSEAFAIYFLFLLGAQLILFFYIPRLTSSHRNRPSLHSGGTLLRPFRYVGNLVNAIPARTPSTTGKRREP